MHRFRRFGVIALGLSVLVAGAVAGARPWSGAPAVPVARAASTWSVTAGGHAPGGVDMIAFFPRTLTISLGDTVNWTMAGFHTVTFNPGQPHLPVFVPGDAPGELQGGPGLFPFPPGPSVPTGPYDGSRQISSGTPQSDSDPPFSLTFTKAGVYQYECLIHPGQYGSLTVLPAGSSAPETPTDAVVRGQDQFAEALAAIQHGVAAVRNASANQPNGSQIAAVAAGISLGDATADIFISDTTTITRGGTVVWTNADPHEIHTVTFTSGGPEPEFVEVLPNPMGRPKLVVRANVAGPAGGNVYTGSEYVNSGILDVGSSWALRFDTPGTYKYLCLVHSDVMRGTVVVTGP